MTNQYSWGEGKRGAGGSKLRQERWYDLFCQHVFMGWGPRERGLANCRSQAEGNSESCPPASWLHSLSTCGFQRWQTVTRHENKDVSRGMKNTRLCKKSKETSIGSLRSGFNFLTMWRIVPRLIITRFYGLHVFAKGSTFFFPWQLLVIAQAPDMSTRFHILRHR